MRGATDFVRELARRAEQEGSRTGQGDDDKVARLGFAVFAG